MAKKVFLLETGIFVLVQVLGIFSALRILEILEVEKISMEPVSFWHFIFGFAIATLFIFFLTKLWKPGQGKIKGFCFAAFFF